MRDSRTPHDTQPPHPMHDTFADDVLPGLFAVSEDPIDPNLLAAYVDGSLSELETRRVEARILRDPETLLLVRTLQEGHGRQRSQVWRWVAVAAVVLLVVGLAWRWRADTGQGGGAPVPGLEQQLAAAVAALGDDDEAHLADFVVPDRDAWQTQTTARGADLVVWPTGVLLTAPDAVRWSTTDGSERFAVHVRGPDLLIRREVEGTSLDLPHLAPGRYTVSLRSLDALAGQPVKRRFEVADDETRARHAEALAHIGARADERTRDLLVAWYALQHRLFVPAREALARAARGPAEVRTEAARALAHLDAIAPAVR